MAKKETFKETLLIEFTSELEMTKEDIDELVKTLTDLGYSEVKVLGTALVSDYFAKQFAEERLSMTVPPLAVAALEDEIEEGPDAEPAPETEEVSEDERTDTEK